MFLRRFDLEHTFRFLKQTLGWTTPRIRTPEAADRWTWLLIAAYTQLRLARPLVEDRPRPWERTPATPARLLKLKLRDRLLMRVSALVGSVGGPGEVLNQRGGYLVRCLAGQPVRGALEHLETIRTVDKVAAMYRPGP